jgi:diguanylate cyclase (GGDEF)-like protein
MQSTIDPLTGLHNRRVLDDYFDAGIRTALEQQRQVALLVLDIDHFKSFNDCLGHDCGDLALREVGALLRRSVRHDDIVCRMGGEEFAVVLPDTPPQEAERTADQLRRLVEGLRLQHDGRMLATITVSIGVATLDPKGDTANALLRRADRALYRAKAAGRNCVAVSSPADDIEPQRRITLVKGHA